MDFSTFISAVETTKDVKAGEEIFVDYKYPKGPFPADYPWYHEARRKLGDIIV